jgi:tetratricopeptide (TPR) repeat protein
MTRSNALYAVFAFALGATVAFASKPKVTFDPKDYYVGKDPKAATAAFLAEAETLAGVDTWERIGLGRVHCLTGNKPKGEALFNAVLGSPKVGKGDIYRIATAYAAAKEWAKAKPLFEKAIAMDPGDDTGIMKAACWFNVNGERARAEELFQAALRKNPDETWHYILAGASYEGVAPF